MKLAFAALAALMVASCTDRTAPVRAEHTTLTAAAVDGPSIYPLGVSLLDDRGDAIGLDVFRQSPVVVSMFYGSCPSACPLIVAHIRQIEDALPPEVRARTRVLLVSFDGEHDTPEALRAIAARHHVDTARWRFASGPDDQVRPIAAALGVTYRKMAEGGFWHNSVISVLDGEGRVVARVDDPSADLAPLIAAVR